MEYVNGIFTLLGIIIASIISQTIAVWVKFSNIEKKLAENRAYLEKKIDESKCPFGRCPLYDRAPPETVSDREMKG